MDIPLSIGKLGNPRRAYRRGIAYPKQAICHCPTRLLTKARNWQYKVFPSVYLSVRFSMYLVTSPSCALKLWSLNPGATARQSILWCSLSNVFCRCGAMISGMRYASPHFVSSLDPPPMTSFHDEGSAKASSFGATRITGPYLW